MLSFAGRAAVVTGAAHGIGRGAAEFLQTLGARVVAIDRDEGALHDAFGDGGCATSIADLGAGGVEQLAEEIWSSHGPIDLLVNNVGIYPARRFFDVRPGEFDSVFNTNLRGPWFFTKRIAQHLVGESRSGAIVFISSLHDHRVGGHPHYSASKAAVSMLVKELAAELAPHGIRVNAVSPGMVRTTGTPISDNSPFRRIVPLGRIGRPADVARMTAVLLSDEWSGYVTGANISVDGGLNLQNWSTCESARPPMGRVVRRFLRPGASRWF